MQMELSKICKNWFGACLEKIWEFHTNLLASFAEHLIRLVSSKMECSSSLQVLPPGCSGTQTPIPNECIAVQATKLTHGSAETLSSISLTFVGLSKEALVLKVPRAGK